VHTSKNPKPAVKDIRNSKRTRVCIELRIETDCKVRAHVGQGSGRTHPESNRARRYCVLWLELSSARIVGER